MSAHRIAAAVLTPVILFLLTACGGDASSEATDEATDQATPEATDEATPEETDAPEPKTFTITGTYAEQGGSEECDSGKDEIIVKSSTVLSIVATGKTSAEGTFDNKAKACLYKFTLPKVTVSGKTYVMVVGTSEPRDFALSDAKGLFITGTAP